LHNSERQLSPLTDVLAYKMLHDPRMSPSKGRIAALLGDGQRQQRAVHVRMILLNTQNAAVWHLVKWALL
tara:strand:+ start:461 stop:670 length:210 start_codon:yes stop_codon:yes gene_type:complete